MPECSVNADAEGGIALPALLKQAGLAPSTSEAVRNVEQGGVKIDGEKVGDRGARLGPGTYVVQVGKRKWARVTVT
jgi:tyrosyl-tRNA synthetase